MSLELPLPWQPVAGAGPRPQAVGSSVPRPARRDGVPLPARPAFSLLEATVVLTIVAILLAIAAPRFAAVRDAAAVQGAMAELGGQFALARQTAIARRAAASVVFDTAAGVVEIRTGGVRVSRRQLGAVYGIVLRSNRDSAVYDARGLGYGVTNLTVTVRRGEFVDTLTMSRLGRTKW